MSSEIETIKKPKPFDSFKTVYKVLVYVGCYKLLKEPSSKFLLYCHNFYRFLYFFLLILLNVQQISYTFLSAVDLNTIMDVLVVEIPQLNLIAKFLTLYFKSSRIDKLHEEMNGPYFIAKGKKDEKYLQQNINEMNRLMKVIIIGVGICGSLWLLTHFLKKMQGENVAIAFYVPVDPETWIGFSIIAVLRDGISVFLAFGHISCDCAVATYYSQATVQLKIIKYNLEHMFDANENAVSLTDNGMYIFRDVKDERLRSRFIYYVQKFDKIVWFTKEVNSVFNFSMSFQFLTATAASCFVIFALSQTKVLAEFIFLLLLLVVYQTQVFLYCYYGNLVEYESQSVCQSAFMSDWYCVSPSLRRSFTIAMSRWTQPLKTRVSVVIPLSVATSIQILRSAYTMFTILSTNDK